MFATNFVGERNIINKPLAAVGADLSCPRICIRNNIENHLKCFHGTFATCSLSVCYIFAVQKYGFCATKVWFLACKNPLFTLQKGGFYRGKRWFLFFAIMVDVFADAGKRFYFAGVVGCVIVTSMQLFWFSRLRRVVRMSSQVIFSTI